MKTLSTFNKSVLSIVIISAATVSFISWDEYQPRHETPSLVEFYQGNHFDKDDILLQSLVSNDSQTLARIAEDNLVAEADLIATAIIEDNYSPEAEDAFAYQAESEQLVLWQEEKTQITDNRDIIIANKVLFDFDSSEISADNFASLNETAQLMQNHSSEQDIIWQVVGYADRSGNYIYNSKLARKRAQEVAQYLVNKGVNEDQLAVMSLGTSNPPNEVRSIDNNRNERRVEIHEYQAEVTALLEQYNAQLKQAKKPSVKEVKIEKPMIVEVDRSLLEKSEKSIPTVSFQKTQIKSLTTAMEL